MDENPKRAKVSKDLFDPNLYESVNMITLLGKLKFFQNGKTVPAKSLAYFLDRVVDTIGEIAHFKWFNSHSKENTELFGRIYVQTSCMLSDYSGTPCEEMESWAKDNDATKYLCKAPSLQEEIKFIQENMPHVRQFQMMGHTSKKYGKTPTFDFLLQDLKTFLNAAKPGDKEKIQPYVTLLEHLLE